MKKLNGILKTFTKTIDQLEDLITGNDKKETKNDVKMSKLAIKKADLVDEREEATIIMNNIKKMLGKDTESNVKE